MLNEKFEIRDEYGSFLRVEQDARGKVTITLKTTTEEENYFTENMTLSPADIARLIGALQRTVEAEKPDHVAHPYKPWET